MKNIDWNLLICSSCVHGEIPYLCRGKIRIGKDEQKRLRREFHFHQRAKPWHGECSAFEQRMG